MFVLDKDDAVYGTVTSVIQRSRMSGDEPKSRPRRTSGRMSYGVAIAIAMLALAAAAAM